jgi:hypothetical protein
MITLKIAMPLLARHEGVWEGQYRYFDGNGQLVDKHLSRLICRFPESGPYPYHQTNIYRWSDGRSETRDYPASFRDGRLHWDSGDLYGWAVAVEQDTSQRSLMLYWQRHDLADSYIYEIVNISDCGHFRSRFAQWIEHGRVKLRTMVDEQLLSKDWQHV